MLLFSLGFIFGFLIRPVMNYYNNYQYYSQNTTKSFEQVIKCSFKDIWSK